MVLQGLDRTSKYPKSPVCLFVCLFVCHHPFPAKGRDCFLNETLGGFNPPCVALVVLSLPGILGSFHIVQ